MSAILEETNVSIDYAENGAIAVSMFSANPEKYSLILMDVNMPEMDGYEATRRIRSLNMPKSKEIPIIAMTANVFKEDIEKCIASGMNNHTGKPVDASALFGLLDEYLNNSVENGVMTNVYELDYGIAWNDDLLTGNTLVDMQHQKIFERINDLIRACQDGSDIAKLGDTLEFLVDHTTRHCTDEEALQLEYKYPDYEHHKKEHEEFRITITNFTNKFKEGGSSAELSNDISKIMVRWLIKHIRREDEKMSKYIRSVITSGNEGNQEP
jgi:hemerythrin-like metal-binding protein